MTAREEVSLQLVLLEEDLCIHGAGGGAFGSPVWFDQLQLSIGQVFLGDLGLYRKNKRQNIIHADYRQSSTMCLFIKYIFSQYL